MALKSVTFRFITGLKRHIFRAARLCGSWDHNGRYADQWTEWPMVEEVAEDGCLAFTATLELDLEHHDTTFR